MPPVNRRTAKITEKDSAMGAKEYVKEHKLQELFVNATAALVNEQPENPKKFLVQFLKDLKQARDAADADACPNVFTEENIVSMYEMFDVPGTGHLSYTQYREAMGNLGITQYNEQPVGYRKNMINRDVFIMEARAGLVSASATYAAYHA
ncbi:EF-hand calcium-binding domain-containing protein 10-like [Sycon ciliatum]|uniref:EF-hand calcium-binding domain-containing protein 10-like n=1 Tax=Sycon ciliatum TaxID=27933 RepID=UPI0031F6ACC0